MAWRHKRPLCQPDTSDLKTLPPLQSSAGGQYTKERANMKHAKTHDFMPKRLPKPTTQLRKASLEGANA